MSDGGILSAVLVVLFGFATFAAGYWLGRERYEEEAVEAGVGEFYIDCNHERQFRWRKP